MAGGWQVWRAAALSGAVLLWVAAGPVQAQNTDEFAALRAQIGKLHGEGNYTEAAAAVESYMALAREKHGEDHADVATAILWLADIRRAQGRHSEAEQLYKRSLMLREKVLGPEHIHVALSLNSLAYLYHAQGRLSEADPLYKRALAIREKALGPDHRANWA